MTTITKKKKQKKNKIKTFKVEGYYYDGKDVYTYIRYCKTLKGKKVKGII